MALPRSSPQPAPLSPLLPLILLISAGPVQLSLSQGPGCTTSPTVYVAPGGSTGVCCGSAAGPPCGSLESALARAASGATIALAGGTYPRSSLTDPLSITQQRLTIQGPASGTPAIIDCGGGLCLDAQCPRGAACVLSLRHVTISNGSGPMGGCLNASQYALDARNTELKNCTASVQGGAVSLVSSPSATLVDVAFTSCAAVPSDLTSPAFGGALYLANVTTALLQRVQASFCSVGGTSSDGGAVYLSGVNRTQVVSSVFTSNNATFRGGSVFTTNSAVELSSTNFSDGLAFFGGAYADVGSTVTMDSCFFQHSRTSASLGLSSGLSDTGGCVYASLSVGLSMSNCTFSECECGYSGGAVYAEMLPTPFLATNCSFDSNFALGGAGLYLSVSSPGGVVHACNFTNNVVKSFDPRSSIPGSPLWGSAVFALYSPVNFSSSHFVNNSNLGFNPDGTQVAPSQGTLMYEGLADQTVSVDECLFQDNYCDGQAGGIWIDSGSININNSKFLNNSVGGLAGAVYSTAVLELSNCVLEGNQGLMRVTYGPIGGGAITQLTTGSLSLSNCNLTSNSMLGANGGAIFVDVGIPVSIASSNFVSNAALAPRGGAMEMLGSSLEVTDSAFFNNSAVNNGGALSVVGSGSSFSFVRSNFTGNSANFGGGAIYSSSGIRASMRHCRLQHNRGALGGAVQLQEFSVFSVNDTLCAFNEASIGGGCFSVAEASKAVVSSSDIVSNEAATEGGAVRVSGLSSVSLTACNVSQNRAQWGAGFWAEMESVLNITNCSVSSNQASYQAGAVYCGQNSTATFSGSNFTSNTGPQGGSVVVTAIARLTATDTSFVDSHPSAVLVQGLSRFSCSRCHFENNTNIGGTGGALAASDEPQVLLTGSHFVSNVALEGGAVFSQGRPQVTIAGCHFLGNKAQVGAGVAMSGSTNASVSGSHFSANSASAAGGAIAFLAQAHGILSSTNFSSNTAAAGGAGVYVLRTNAYGSNISATPLTAVNLVFSNNVALLEGGGAYFDATPSPLERTSCQFCSSAHPSDTLGTVPADLDLSWPGNGYSLRSQGSFAILTDVGTSITGLKVTVLDYYGNKVTNDNSSVAMVSPDSRISGLLRGTAVQGVVSIPPINVQVPPSAAASFNLNITVSSPSGSFAPFFRSFYISFCPGGNYYDSATFTCQPCIMGWWCAPGQPMQPCPSGSFSFFPGAQSVDDCTECNGALNCNGGQLQMQWQNWLDPTTLNTSSPTTYPCLVTNGCPGLGSPSPYSGLTYEYNGTDTVQCEPGYSEVVPTCGLCTSNHYYFIGYCYPCTQLFKDVFFVLLAVVVTAWVLMVITANNLLCVDNFLNEVQLIVLIGSTNLNFPTDSLWMMRILQLYNLTVFDPDLIGPQCWFPYSFQERFYVSLAIPLVGLAVYGLLFLRHRYFHLLFVHVHSFRKESFDNRVLERSLSRRRESSDYANSIIHACTNWLDICYILVLTRVLAVFGPQTIGDTTVLALAPQIVWLSTEHIAMMAVGTVYGLAYIVGLPLFYVYILMEAKRNSTFGTTEFKQKFGWITERYKRQFWWWHLTNIILRIAHAAILVFLIGSTNIQVVIFLPIQALRIAMQWKSSALASLSLDYLQASLTLGEFMFTFSLVAYNYMNLQLFSEILYGVSTALILLPFCVAFAYEAVNKHLELRNNQLLSKMWKLEKKHHKYKFENMDPYDLVDLHEVSEWFRPHIISALLLSKRRTHERQLLLRVRDRVQACKVHGLANVDWVNHLKKPQLYAVLSQALLGASAGHITVARIPRNGFFCKLHGLWHTQEECSAHHGHTVPGLPQPQAEAMGTAGAPGGVPAGGASAAGAAPGHGKQSLKGAQEGRVASVAWPPTLERHISWASHGSMDMDSLARDRDRAIAEAIRRAEEMPPLDSTSGGAAASRAAGPDGVSLPSPLVGGTGLPPRSPLLGPSLSSNSGAGGPITPCPSVPAPSEQGDAVAIAGAVGQPAPSHAAHADDPAQLMRAPSIRVQNLRVSWGAGVPASRAGGEGGPHQGVPGVRTARQDEEVEFVEAKMNMTELTFTFQRHLSVLVHSEKKKKDDSLRLLIRSEYIPTILSWLTCPSSTQEDQRLLRRLVVALRDGAIEEAGGLGWWQGILFFCRCWPLRPNYTQEVESLAGDTDAPSVPDMDADHPLPPHAAQEPSAST